MPLRIELSVDTTSPGVGLSRRRSLLKRSSSQNAGTEARINSSLSYRRIPTEMLERILDDYIRIVRFPEIPGTSLCSFAVFTKWIEPYMTVSKSFRYLILRSFFRVLTFGKDDAAPMLRLLSILNAQYCAENGGYFWVKSLVCPSYQVAPNSKILSSLMQLRTMEVDFTNSGLSSQRLCLAQFFGSFSRHNVTLNLTSLVLTRLPRIDIHLLTMIAIAMPTLRTLRLTSAEGLDTGCCPNCYEDSLSRIVHSPIPHLYPDVQSLAGAYGRALQNLKQLKTLFLGVYLSPTHVLDFHVDHGANVMDITPTTSQSVYNCPRCAKYERTTRERELLASLILAQHLDSIENVGWDTLFLPPCKHSMECSRCATDFFRGQINRDANPIDTFKCGSGVNCPSQDTDADNGKHDHDKCGCRNGSFVARLKVRRTSSTIEVYREAVE